MSASAPRTAIVTEPLKLARSVRPAHAGEGPGPAPPPLLGGWGEERTERGMRKVPLRVRERVVCGENP